MALTPQVTVTQILSPTSATAKLISYLGTDVAANTEFSETVPAGKLWTLLSVTVSLVQGITDVPQPQLVIDDGTNVLYQGYCSTIAQVVSTTCQYTWVSGGPPAAALVGATTNVAAVCGFGSPMTLGAGYRIRSNTIAKGANSNYGAPAFLVVETTL